MTLTTSWRRQSRRHGGFAVAAGAPARIEQAVPAGRYRLEVFDGASGAATSVRFAGGWWAQVAPAGAPDRVEVVTMLPSYRAGETAWVYVRPPWRAQVLLALADREVRQVEARTLGPEGGVFEIPVDAAWAPGISVVATAVPTAVVSAAAELGACGAVVGAVGSAEVLTGAASEAVSSPHATRTRPAAQHSAAIRRLRGDMPPGYPL
jgi:uncharacterized protein YfaS (alpha-2-macroglobulin family)